MDRYAILKIREGSTLANTSNMCQTNPVSNNEILYLFHQKFGFMNKLDGNVIRNYRFIIKMFTTYCLSIRIVKQ